ncbi:hypothetical protein GCM10022420_038390 [Streptomyces iranensis]
MPLGLRIGQPLQQQHTDALTPTGAIRRLGKRLAAAVGSQPTLPGKLHECDGCGHHCRPTSQGHRALTTAQRHTRLVQSHQRRGTRGVHRHRRTLKAEHIGKAAGHGTGRVTRQKVPITVFGVVLEPRKVILTIGSDEYSDW